MLNFQIHRDTLWVFSIFLPLNVNEEQKIRMHIYTVNKKSNRSAVSVEMQIVLTSPHSNKSITLHSVYVCIASCLITAHVPLAVTRSRIVCRARCTSFKGSTTCCWHRLTYVSISLMLLSRSPASIASMPRS